MTILEILPPQRTAIETFLKGAALVIDSRKNARAAAGIVIDSGFRDSANIANLAIPLFNSRPSAPTNLTLHQALDINLPIACGDVAVFPGDIILETMRVLWLFQRKFQMKLLMNMLK